MMIHLANIYQSQNSEHKLTITHIFLEQAALEGFSSRCPFSSNFIRDMGSIAGYGVFPPVNISQHVTPKAHCRHRMHPDIKQSRKCYQYCFRTHTNTH